MQTVEMHIDDGRTWLGQLHHFVTRAACTLWGPACRGAGRSGQWTALAVGMAVALAASPGQAVPAVPAGGFGMPTPVSPVNEAIVADDLDAAERLSDLGDRYVVQHTANWVPMEAGDTIVYDYGGGGGWGDPLARPPEKVLELFS